MKKHLTTVTIPKPAIYLKGEEGDNFICHNFPGKEKCEEDGPFE